MVLECFTTYQWWNQLHSQEKAYGTIGTQEVEQQGKYNKKGIEWKTIFITKWTGGKGKGCWGEEQLTHRRHKD